MPRTPRTTTLRRCLLALLLASLPAVAPSQRLDADPGEALAAYVAAPDASYAWRVQRRYRHRHADVVELRLESQT
jgi:hypothetical protein